MSEPLRNPPDGMVVRVPAPAALLSECVPSSKAGLSGWPRSKSLSFALLLGATAFGLAVAQWTSSAHLPQLPRLSAAINPMAHLFVFGLWMVAWGGCWKHVFGQKGGRFCLVLVPVLAAFAGEAVEVFWPGHQFDVRDVLLNLVGVAIALWMGNKFTSLPRPASNGPPGN